jgi:agmatinase
MSENTHADAPPIQQRASDASFFKFPTFMGCKHSQNFLSDDVDVVISGVPFDLATTERLGARFGPAAIRKASRHLAWEINRWPWDFHVFDEIRAIDYGDLCFEPLTIDGMMVQLQQHAAQILAADKYMLTLGGDHLITLPLLRELAKKHGSVALIHFDAHTDTEREREQYHHGTLFFHAVNEGIVAPDRSIQIGTRTEHIQKDHIFTVLDADRVMNLCAYDVSMKIKAAVGNHPAYVTFDIDCLDPAFAPGTGTPVVGGLSTNLALQIIRQLLDCNLIGMDIVEVSPPYDHSEITSLAAATLALELLYVLAASRKEN